MSKIDPKVIAVYLTMFGVGSSVNNWLGDIGKQQRIFNLIYKYGLGVNDTPDEMNYFIEKVSNQILELKEKGLLKTIKP